MTEICICNNCRSILFDENPQVGAKKYAVNNLVHHMKQIKKEGEVYWVCPVCETDEYLQDDIPESELNEVLKK